MRPILPFLLLFALPAFAAGSASALKIRALEEGGYAVERAPAGVTEISGGIAELSELAPILAAALPNAEKIDFSKGVKLEGIFTITVGREDGTLGKYEEATDVFVFARPDTLNTVQKITTLDGAVVFALKIDNTPNGVPVQRLEQGVITLTPDDKSV